MSAQPAIRNSVEYLPDAGLVERVLGGDLSAMETLMRRHNRTLYRTARAILRDDAEAEDAVQEAYVQAFAALGSFRGDSKLSTWLVRIAANEALARRRRAARASRLMPMEGNADAAQLDGVSLAPGPEDDAARGEARRLLETHIGALPDGYRAVFVLRALEELSVEETAAALCIPAATVRTRYFRARGLLREWLAQDIDVSLAGAFAFAGARCDHVVRKVLARLAGNASP